MDSDQSFEIDETVDCNMDEVNERRATRVISKSIFSPSDMSSSAGEDSDGTLVEENESFRTEKIEDKIDGEETCYDKVKKMSPQEISELLEQIDLNEKSLDSYCESESEGNHDQLQDSKEGETRNNSKKANKNKTGGQNRKKGANLVEKAEQKEVVPLETELSVNKPRVGRKKKINLETEDKPGNEGDVLEQNAEMEPLEDKETKPVRTKKGKNKVANKGNGDDRSPNTHKNLSTPTEFIEEKVEDTEPIIKKENKAKNPRRKDKNVEQEISHNKEVSVEEKVLETFVVKETNTKKPKKGKKIIPSEEEASNMEEGAAAKEVLSKHTLPVQENEIKIKPKRGKNRKAFEDDMSGVVKKEDEITSKDLKEKNGKGKNHRKEENNILKDDNAQKPNKTRNKKEPVAADTKTNIRPENPTESSNMHLGHGNLEDLETDTKVENTKGLPKTLKNSKKASSTQVSKSNRNIVSKEVLKALSEKVTHDEQNNYPENVLKDSSKDNRNAQTQNDMGESGRSLRSKTHSKTNEETSTEKKVSETKKNIESKPATITTSVPIKTSKFTQEKETNENKDNTLKKGNTKTKKTNSSSAETKENKALDPFSKGKSVDVNKQTVEEKKTATKRAVRKK